MLRAFLSRLGLRPSAVAAITRAETTDEAVAIRRGQSAEAVALAHLERAGLRLVVRNYRCRRGELDLVMRDGDITVFVEVRYRRDPAYGSPAETIDARKQARLRAAAEHYLQRHPRASKNPCRFDIVAIRGGIDRIEWLVNAL